MENEHFSLSEMARRAGVAKSHAHSLKSFYPADSFRQGVDKHGRPTILYNDKAVDFLICNTKNKSGTQKCDPVEKIKAFRKISDIEPEPKKEKAKETELASDKSEFTPSQIKQLSMIDYQTRKTRFQALHEQFDFRVKKGQYVDKNLWDKSFFGILEGIRASFMSSVEYLAKTMIGETDEEKIKAALYAEYKRIFSDLETYRTRIKSMNGVQ